MNNTNFDPISILQIEDNPGQYGLDAVAINRRAGKQVFSEEISKPIPCVHFKDADHIYRHFDLHVLQHPVEIKEYIQLISDAASELGEHKLSSIKGAVPEIIIFDYLFGENITTNKDNPGNIAYTEEERPIREVLNPNFKLLEKTSSSKVKELFLEINTNYTDKDFIYSISKKTVEDLGKLTEEERKHTFDKSALYQRDKNCLQKDQLGLFAGISIWNLFKNHISIAIPATANATTIEAIDTYSKYFEWLHDYELGDMMKEGIREQKTWDEIIPKAVKQLRNRIFQMAEQGKVTFDIHNLSHLASLNNDAELDKEGLVVATTYGQKCYNVNALFFDHADVKERQNAIADYSNSILKNVMKFSDNKELEQIITEFTGIWRTYKKSFGDMIHLSTYYTESLLGAKVVSDPARFQQLKERYPLKDKKSISNTVSAFKSDLRDESKRLLLLLLATKAVFNLNKNYSDFIVFKRRYSYALANERLTYLNDEDLSYVFGPIHSEYAKHPYALEMHIDLILGGAPNDRLNQTTIEMENLGFSIDKKNDKSNLRFVNSITKNIKKHELLILKCFFDQEMKTFSKLDHPLWLK